jgi:hypothetical protein
MNWLGDCPRIFYSDVHVFSAILNLKPCQYNSSDSLVVLQTNVVPNGSSITSPVRHASHLVIVYNYALALRQNEAMFHVEHCSHKTKNVPHGTLQYNINNVPRGTFNVIQEKS